MSEKPLEQLQRQVEGGSAQSLPPLHLWNPPLSGDIDIVIRADGTWWHEGDPIRRAPLVQLFASILRREDDGEYYLVTPVEKWRVQVECLPLIGVDVERIDDSLEVRLNTERRVRVGVDYPLRLLAEPENAIAVDLENGLSALLARAAWYRLAEEIEERDGTAGVTSGTAFFPLVATGL